MTVLCTFCNKNPAMVKCRDCEGPGACYSCTVSGPTGGFCSEHLGRFMQVHHKDHEQEYEDFDWAIHYMGDDQKIKKGRFIPKQNTAKKWLDS